MTSSALKHGPLTADMVPLLTPESVLSRQGDLCSFVRAGDDCAAVHLWGGDFDSPSFLSELTYIGERNADGWITCEGGWSENPVPGMVVEYRVRSGSTWALPQQVPSEALRWGCGFSGEPVAFRLAATPAASQPGISAPAEMDKKTPAGDEDLPLDCDLQARFQTGAAVSGEPETGGVWVSRDVTTAMEAEFINIDGPWTRGQLTTKDVWDALRDAAALSTPPVDQSRGERGGLVRRAVYDWIRDDAPLNQKMTTTPALVDKLLIRILAALSQGGSDV